MRALAASAVYGRRCCLRQGHDVLQRRGVVERTHARHWRPAVRAVEALAVAAGVVARRDALEQLRVLVDEEVEVAEGALARSEAVVVEEGHHARESRGGAARAVDLGGGAPAK